MAVFVARCSLQIARRLGALPARIKGPEIWSAPDNCIILDVDKNQGGWYWPLDEILLNEYHEFLRHR